jgi:DNA-binding ferritin-like protein
MFAESLHDCEEMIQLAVAMFDEATQERQQGIANYMAELQDLYAKKAWFIRSTLKKERE